MRIYIYIFSIFFLLHSCVHASICISHSPVCVYEYVYVFVKIYSMYRYDLRVLFIIEPVDVLQRMLYSFVPGKHAPLLVAPDLYGPLVAVMSLPQVMPCVLFGGLRIWYRHELSISYWNWSVDTRTYCYLELHFDSLPFHLSLTSLC